MKWAISLIFSLAVISLISFPVHANTNNPFGMHLAGLADQDFQDVAHLVNSNGGDWGYVTIVIPENDRDHKKWQEIFDQLRRLHLIPIVRLASKPDGAVWTKPNEDEIKNWVSFLNGLNWVVKDRYVILFNEPNHGSEWGGTADPKSYASSASQMASDLKSSNKDYFVMLAGLDAAAPQSPPSFTDEEVFIKDMIAAKPQIFDTIDGWVSHSYPNPNFSGSPYATGRNSIRNYAWELDLLESLGVHKNLPVFITETGWVHAEGTALIPSYLSAQQVAQNYTTLFTTVSQDERIRAITPFVLDYQEDPFSHFSFKMLGVADFYPQYDAIRSLTKPKGNPPQLQKIIITSNLPTNLLQDSTYTIDIDLSQEGQAILDQKDGYELRLEGDTTSFSYFFSDLSAIEPFEKRTVTLFLKTKGETGEKHLTISLYKNTEKVFDLFSYDVTIKKLPNIVFSASLIPKVKSDGLDYQIQLFNAQERMVFNRANLAVKNGKGTVPEIQYRIGR